MTKQEKFDAILKYQAEGFYICLKDESGATLTVDAVYFKNGVIYGFVKETGTGDDALYRRKDVTEVKVYRYQPATLICGETTVAVAEGGVQ